MGWLHWPLLVGLTIITTGVFAMLGGLVAEKEALATCAFAGVMVTGVVLIVLLMADAWVRA